jgi:hypothetical protein
LVLRFHSGLFLYADSPRKQKNLKKKVGIAMSVMQGIGLTVVIVNFVLISRCQCTGGWHSAAIGGTVVALIGILGTLIAAGSIIQFYGKNKGGAKV